MNKIAKASLGALGALAMTFAMLSSASAAESTVTGKLVDAAKWISNDSTTMTLTMPDIMMSSMMSSMMSNMMPNATTGMPGADTGMSAHHPSGQSTTSPGMPMGSGMTGGMSMGCHSMLGVVTPAGDLYLLLANRTSPMGALALCARVGQEVTVTGTTYARGGFRALLVSKFPG